MKDFLVKIFVFYIIFVLCQDDGTAQIATKPLSCPPGTFSTLKGPPGKSGTQKITVGENVT